MPRAQRQQADQTNIAVRAAGLDWARIAAELDSQGCATTGPLLSAAECADLAATYDRDPLYRSRVVMARHGFGQGEYRYFSYPLPPLVAERVGASMLSPLISCNGRENISPAG